MGLNLPIAAQCRRCQAQFFFYAMMSLRDRDDRDHDIDLRSKLGSALRCIQQNEDAANILGVNTYALQDRRLRRCPRSTSGIAGAIYASWVNYIEPPDVFDVLLSVKPIVMVLLGGARHHLRAGDRRGRSAVAFEELVWRNFLTIHAAALGIIIVAAGAVPARTALLSLVRANWLGARAERG